MFLAVILSATCVFAEDNETAEMKEIDDEYLQINDTAVSQETNNITETTQQKDINVTLSSDDTNVVKGKYFSVKVSDENGTGIANKAVTFKINGVTSKVNTTSKGIAKLLVNESEGKYTVKYSFSETGYAKASGSSKILVVSTSKSKLTASGCTAYYKLKNFFVVTLTVGGLKLSGREIKVTINKKTYTNKTNSKGRAYFAIGLNKGKYAANYSYAGEKNIKKSSGKATITVKKISTEFKKVNDVIYRHKTDGTFKVKLVDERGNLLKNKTVKFTFNKKSYTKKTNSKGIIKVNFKLSMGAYTLKLKFKETSVYKKTTKTYTIKVKSKKVKNNGLWLLSTDMYNVNLTHLKSVNVKHIFLNAKAIERFGKTNVEKFISNAGKNKIKVHLWMQVFYNSDGWVYPVKNGKIKYDLINSKVKEAKKYAKVKGVAGVHFDYLRFPGNAYNYKNAVKAVNYFTKKAANAVHKVNSKLVVSAAVMPEPSSMKYYYAQDIPTISKYLDVIIPMVYKGNYGAGYPWVKSTTSKFVKMSKGAQIWTGLQSYRSDSNVSQVPAHELMNDADYSGFGGATGVILFRYGLIDYFNFGEI